MDDDTRNDRAMIKSELVEELVMATPEDLPARARVLLLVLIGMSEMHKGGWLVWGLSVSDLMLLTGMSRATVGSAARDLERAELVRCHRGGGREPNKYLVVQPASWRQRMRMRR